MQQRSIVIKDKDATSTRSFKHNLNKHVRQCKPKRGWQQGLVLGAIFDLCHSALKKWHKASSTNRILIEFGHGLFLTPSLIGMGPIKGNMSIMVGQERPSHPPIANSHFRQLRTLWEAANSHPMAMEYLWQGPQ